MIYSIYYRGLSLEARVGLAGKDEGWQKKKESQEEEEEEEEDA